MFVYSCKGSSAFYHEYSFIAVSINGLPLTAIAVGCVVSCESMDSKNFQKANDRFEFLDSKNLCFFHTFIYSRFWIGLDSSKTDKLFSFLSDVIIFLSEKKTFGMDLTVTTTLNVNHDSYLLISVQSSNLISSHLL